MLRLRGLGQFQIGPGYAAPRPASAPQAAPSPYNTGNPQIDAFFASPLAKAAKIGLLCASMARAFPNSKFFAPFVAGTITAFVTGIAKE